MCVHLCPICDAYIMNKNGSNYFNCVLNLLIDQCFVVDDGVAFFVVSFHFIFQFEISIEFFFCSLATDKMSRIKWSHNSHGFVLVFVRVCVHMSVLRWTKKQSWKIVHNSNSNSNARWVLSTSDQIHTHAPRHAYTQNSFHTTWQFTYNYLCSAWFFCSLSLCCFCSFALLNNR